MNKSEIARLLDEKVNAFNDYVRMLDQKSFEATPGGKWSAGQNLDHLIRAIKPLQPAYMLPKFLIGWKFGKANRPSRSYDELVTKYKLKLAGGGRASGRFVPPLITFGQKEHLLESYEIHKQKLIKKINKQNEAELDKYILPHPLLGKLTMREMLYFTIYHNDHHLQQLKER